MYNMIIQIQRKQKVITYYVISSQIGLKMKVKSAPKIKIKKE
jgi:hypothetical protein